MLTGDPESNSSLQSRQWKRKNTAICTENHRVSTQKQFADKPLLVNGLCLLALACFWYFGPHLEKKKKKKKRKIKTWLVKTALVESKMYADILKDSSLDKAA